MSCQIKRLRFVFGLTVIGLLLATGAAVALRTRNSTPRCTARTP